MKFQGPRFKHDCEACLFISRFDGRMHDDYADAEQQLFDLYFCPGRIEAKLLLGSVILRYGDEGSQYASGEIDIILARSHKSSRLLDAAREILDRRLVRLTLDVDACAKLRADLG